jgi:hypothetical protein
MSSKPITPCNPESGREVMIPAWTKVEVICANGFSRLMLLNKHRSIIWIAFCSYFYTDFQKDQLYMGYFKFENIPSMTGISMPAWNRIEPHTLSVFCVIHPQTSARGTRMARKTY